MMSIDGRILIDRAFLHGCCASKAPAQQAVAAVLVQFTCQRISMTGIVRDLIDVRRSQVQLNCRLYHHLTGVYEAYIVPN